MGAGFSGAEAASHNLLDEVLEEATYLKEPTIMLLASFTSCLLAECLSKAGDDDTRAELSSSISQVTTIYPHLQASLSRKWNSREAAIGELRVCVDALFDVLSTLDDILETLLEERVVPGLHQLEPPVMGAEPALSQFMAHETTLKAKPVAEEGLEVTSVPITEYPEGGSSSVADSMVSNAGSLGVEGTQDGEGSAGEEREIR
ncbi:uncharacterized protein H6S33_006965 [Morchella sextelata]|uniref:uncharacterized protein n=1 Tax=Morchella sextelata TaxID=1174677 RepID=UPI001D0382D8|nr:uncharacterized protein H6S33_006965 [Morchella sextelata]KAH0603934.1 hypothetical protein H6S33_006965 [Morchella sextelata]